MMSKKIRTLIFPLQNDIQIYYCFDYVATRSQSTFLYQFEQDMHNKIPLRSLRIKRIEITTIQSLNYLLNNDMPDADVPQNAFGLLSRHDNNDKKKSLNDDNALYI